MALIKYPTTDYNSFVTEEEADAFFETHLHASKWDSGNKEAALLQAFRSISALDITIDPTVTAELAAIAEAQMEQALYEMTVDVHAPPLSSMNLGGILSVKLPSSQQAPKRYSTRAMEILSPYMSVTVVNRTR